MKSRHATYHIPMHQRTICTCEYSRPSCPVPALVFFCLGSIHVCSTISEELPIRLSIIQSHFNCQHIAIFWCRLLETGLLLSLCIAVHLYLSLSLSFFLSFIFFSFFFIAVAVSQLSSTLPVISSPLSLTSTHSTPFLIIIFFIFSSLSIHTSIFIILLLTRMC
ncbi:hypothetical protein BCR41DRAFT_125265 [Lobosporangium transversale]|uniref:Uncharacterized protein n=1 Tax=Lobosporangium transversale TaxID=64571 RepID=A0A1Y2H0A6_9FUNG|nr:hypothetical protein BCR41DRAFT_125265 [Lobosporangium transversale]ORZ27966.1 hypothetical protein BCR41DRAFT_125265 [Lobosporangium transversale]|eukprot:XP_021885669.1 hypothetical protein BCR41DRAFT_125265 [Lobosporangium transversale]